MSKEGVSYYFDKHSLSLWWNSVGGECCRRHDLCSGNKELAYEPSEKRYFLLHTFGSVDVTDLIKKDLFSHVPSDVLKWFRKKCRENKDSFQRQVEKNGQSFRYVRNNSWRCIKMDGLYISYTSNNKTITIWSENERGDVLEMDQTSLPFSPTGFTSTKRKKSLQILSKLLNIVGDDISKLEWPLNQNSQENWEIF